MGKPAKEQITQSSSSEEDVDISSDSSSGSEEEDSNDSDFESESASEADEDDEDFEPTVKKQRTAKGATAVKKGAPPKAAPSRKSPAVKNDTSEKSKENATPPKPKATTKKTAAPKTAPAKAKPKKMSGVECENAIVAYCDRTNRPYSDGELHLNMHKPVGKTEFNRILAKLVKAKRLDFRENGKFKIYWSDQSQYPKLSMEEMDTLDTGISDRKEEQKELKSQISVSNEKIASLSKLSTLEDLKQESDATKAKLKAAEERLASLRDSSESVDPNLRKRMIDKLKAHKKLWKERKDNCMDFLYQMSEGMQKSISQTYEIVGIDTDEENGMSYKEFATNVNKLL